MNYSQISKALPIYNAIYELEDSLKQLNYIMVNHKESVNYTVSIRQPSEFEFAIKEIGWKTLLIIIEELIDYKETQISLLKTKLDSIKC